MECKVTQKMVDYIESHRTGDVFYDKGFFLVVGEDIVIEEVNNEFTRCRIRIVSTGGGCWLPVDLFDIEVVQFANAQKAEKEHEEFCKSVDWNNVRVNASIAAMNGIISNQQLYERIKSNEENYEKIKATISLAAIDYADRLIADLKKK